MKITEERNLCLFRRNNIKFGKKKTIKACRLNIETTNLTEYQTSAVRMPHENIFDHVHNGVSNLLCSQNVSVSSVDK